MKILKKVKKYEKKTENNTKSINKVNEIFRFAVKWNFFKRSCTFCFIFVQLILVIELRGGCLDFMYNFL